MPKKGKSNYPTAHLPVMPETKKEIKRTAGKLGLFLYDFIDAMYRLWIKIQFINRCPECGAEWDGRHNRCTAPGCPLRLGEWL